MSEKEVKKALKPLLDILKKYGGTVSVGDKKIVIEKEETPPEEE